MEYSGAGRKLILEKNQKQKISWHCPFKVEVIKISWHCPFKVEVMAPTRNKGPEGGGGSNSAGLSTQNPNYYVPLHKWRSLP